MHGFFSATRAPSQPRDRDSSDAPAIKYRLRELRRLMAFRYGATLPDDAGGRDFAFVMLCHVAHSVASVRNHRLRKNWLGEHCPWMPQAERDKLLARRPLTFCADTLARRLAITGALRQALDFRTIGACDMDKDQRKAAARQRQRDRERDRRRANGVKPRAAYIASLATSASRVKPWEAAGVSRPTWYRRRRKAGETRSAAHMKETKSL